MCLLLGNQNQVYLFWPDGIAHKGFFFFSRVWKHSRGPKSSLQLLESIRRACLQLFGGHNVRVAGFLLSSRTERLLLMTYFGKENNRPLCVGGQNGQRHSLAGRRSSVCEREPRNMYSVLYESIYITDCRSLTGNPPWQGLAFQMLQVTDSHLSFAPELISWHLRSLVLV